MAPLEPGTQIGPYIVEQLLPAGKGGMARVCVATRADEQGQTQRVALKVAEIPDSRKESGATLQEFYTDAINNEVDKLRQLHHPGIVQTYPIPWDERRLVYSARATQLVGQPWYFVMEYLQGGSVSERIKSQGRLQVREAVEIAHQISQALDYLHSKHIAHLDIKTENILLRFPVTNGIRPEAVLVDFGIARGQGQTGLDAGSLSFLAPERVRELRGETPPEQLSEQIRTPADVYGLGVIFYHMLTGHLPFTGRSKTDITTAILTTTPTRPVKLNPELDRYPKIEDLIFWMLDKNPKARPSADQVTGYLDLACAPPRFYGTTVTKDLPHGDKTGTDNRTDRPSRLIMVFLALVAGFALLATGTGAGYYLWNGKGRTATPSATTATPFVATTLAPTPTRVPTATLTPLPSATSVPNPAPVVPASSPPPPIPSTVPPTIPPPMASIVPTHTPLPTRPPTAAPAPSSTPTPTQ